MNPGILSLLALVVAIAVGYLRKVNTGIISIALAFLIGRFVVDMEPGAIVGGWPLKLFFVLLGMTFLFSIATANGTLSLIAQKVTFLARGHRKLIPVVFFFMAGGLAAVGPGNISICALVLPIAMAVASEEDIPPLLMASVVIAGANAGGLSPIAPTGIIGVTLARQQGLDIGGPVFVNQIIGQGILAAILYLLLGGYRLQRDHGRRQTPPPFDRRQAMTMGVVLLVVIGIIAGKWDIGLTAFLGAALLVFLKAADETEAVAAIPWSTLILVCGVGVLINVCRVAGGIDTLTRLLATLMNRHTVAPIMAITGGLMSIVSSASGVVMPTLIPAVPKLVNTIGGDVTEVVSSIIMGAHVVTNSPLSTLGALAVASAGKDVDKKKLFTGLLVLAMAGLVYAATIVFVGLV